MCVVDQVIMQTDTFDSMCLQHMPIWSLEEGHISCFDS